MTDTSSSIRKDVLIVDDEPSIRNLLKKMNEREGFLCDAASNGREALDHLRRTSYQVALIDYKMPGMTGLELIRKIKQDPKNKGITIILVSSALPPHLDPVIRASADIDEIIPKSLLSKELIRKLRSRIACVDPETEESGMK
ncbi:response regulator [Thermodesulfobacteriota bacterium]